MSAPRIDLNTIPLQQRAILDTIQDPSAEQALKNRANAQALIALMRGQMNLERSVDEESQKVDDRIANMEKQLSALEGAYRQNPNEDLRRQINTLFNELKDIKANPALQPNAFVSLDNRVSVMQRILGTLGPDHSGPTENLLQELFTQIRGICDDLQRMQREKEAERRRAEADEKSNADAAAQRAANARNEKATNISKNLKWDIEDAKRYARIWTVLLSVPAVVAGYGTSMAVRVAIRILLEGKEPLLKNPSPYWTITMGTASSLCLNKISKDWFGWHHLNQTSKLFEKYLAEGKEPEVALELALSEVKRGPQPPQAAPVVAAAKGAPAPQAAPEVAVAKGTPAPAPLAPPAAPVAKEAPQLIQASQPASSQLPVTVVQAAPVAKRADMAALVERGAGKI